MVVVSEGRERCEDSERGRVGTSTIRILEGSMPNSVDNPAMKSCVYEMIVPYQIHNRGTH